jgi:hypothetical protein
MWSLEGEQKLLGYLKNHAMLSSLHVRQSSKDRNEHWMNEEALDEHLMGVVISQIECVEDTFAQRQVWRDHATLCKEHKQLDADGKRDASAAWGDQGDHQQCGWGSKETWDDQRGQRWESGKWGNQQPWKRRDTSNDSQGDKIALEERLASMQGQIQTLAAAGAPSGSVPDATPSFILAQLKHLDVVMEPHLNLTEVQEKLITVPLSTLMLLKETVTRSKEAVRSTMNSMMAPLNSLRIEISVLANTEDVVEKVIQEHKKKAT